MIAQTIRTCFPLAARAVSQRADEINKLNVFPVPDGDTGTNMSLTLASVVRELGELPADAGMPQIAEAITHGSLMGARGNSGVITSQILRGVAEGLGAASDPVSTQDIASALRRSVKVAFKAVRKPVEGTILTVLRDISARADACEKAHDSVAEALDAIVAEAYRSVARTPDLLPVLKDNGVVDSGAFGFAIFLESFVSSALGRSSAVEDFSATFSTDASNSRLDALGRVEIEAIDDWEGSRYRYCNEFLFKAEAPIDEEEVLDFLSTMGDCELLVGSYPTYKIHVHSNIPDRVIAHMLELGQVFEVFIHNMDIEAAERRAKIRAETQAARPGAPKPIGFVAVAAGSGEADILTSLGVDVVVSGGQTMNPSTADLLEAVSRVDAESVIILPNNSNILMAAEAAATAAGDRRVVVVPTKTVPQAFSALFAVLPDATLDEAVASMTDAVIEVRDGEITRAVRDSAAADGSPIRTGDVMGIISGSIDVVGADVKSVTLECVKRMQASDEGDSLTILAGEELSDDAFADILAALSQAHPDLEIDAHRGEQPLYPVIFSIE
ncbi:DAK2 domain fusion protein YloV [Coriobacterium glomerans PW2]|uniref:DAK2 domain fusion protein YloV n=1 Tax=Coriobacterium glomerans (strain ATCC 49209 / DSM 20642 / JCM 10262 / PW2) TaxID=700015 RepID=F2N9R6_CORGP|nr:DAK2 domain-containing protein [Coriobacterium glomerans]AEB07169.1 DAK2 domain fusion protein YloV [Coriobacterium glomerans PW2]